MEKSIVYVPHVPSRFDDGTRMWIPTVNIRAAEKYGKLNVMFTPDVSSFSTAPIAAAMRAKMEAFTPNDYVLAVGDPSLIIAMGVYAAKAAGGVLRVLKWDRLVRDYLVVEIRL